MSTSSLKYIPGTGPFNPSLMIIGEAPGAQEEVNGIPFTGPSGKLLRQALQEVGIQEDDCYFTNIVKVRPPGNRTPTVDECLSWKSLLCDEIINIDPKLVILTGNIPLWTLTNEDTTISKARGKFILTDTYVVKWHVLPIYHPSYILRNRQHYGTFLADLVLAREFIRDAKQRPMSEGCLQGTDEGNET